MKTEHAEGEEEERKNICPGKQSSGRVWLVGAGPGAPDLVTKRGCDLLRTADVVVYDALILPETIAMIPENVEKIYVGKRAGAHSVPQEEIQEILIREAGQGKRVVRLKGGDPFVFGRGGEEALALVEHGIPCEVVPGVTSAVAVPEAFGIPVTHRGLATSFTVITGHGQATDRVIDYDALVRTGGTLIFLMGLSAARKICRGLMDAGMEACVPAAALSKGTTPAQRMVLSTVGRLADDIQAAALAAPAILVVGKVCSLAPELSVEREEEKSRCLEVNREGEEIQLCEENQESENFRLCRENPESEKSHFREEMCAPVSTVSMHEERAIAGEENGVTVVVTRQAEKAGAFSARLRKMGVNVRELPAIRIRKAEGTPRDEVFRSLRELCSGTENCGTVPAWLVFTSANGVDAFFELLIEAGLDMRSLLGGSEKRFAAVGSKTADALKRRGILPDLIPAEYTGAALGEELAERIGDYAGKRKTESSKDLRENGKGKWRDGKTYPVCEENRKMKFSGEAAVWFFGAKKTDGALEAALAARNIPLKTVHVYETVSAVKQEDAQKLAGQILEGREKFLFTFTSASCVRNLAAAVSKATSDFASGLTEAELDPMSAATETELDPVPAVTETELDPVSATTEAAVCLKQSDTVSDEGSSDEKKAESAAGLLRGLPAVCIGEKTARAARQAGMRVVVSKESTEEGMLETLNELLVPGSQAPAADSD